LHSAPLSEDTETSADRGRDSAANGQASAPEVDRPEAEGANGDDAGHGLRVDFFKKLLSTKKERLENFCQVWERKLEDELPKEAAGQIRCVVGMGRILTGRKGRLQQFSDLIGDCQYHRGDNVTTLEDLQGYWDLVTPEIEKLDSQFKELAFQECQKWVKPEPKKRKPTKVVAKQAAGAAAAGAVKKPVTKGASKFRQFLAMKMKQEQAEVGSARNEPPKTPKIFAGGAAANDPEFNLFEGGFFHVRTPTRRSASPKPETRGFALATIPKAITNRRISQILLTSAAKFRRSRHISTDEGENRTLSGISPVTIVVTDCTDAAAAEATSQDNATPRTDRQSDDPLHPFDARSVERMTVPLGQDLMVFTPTPDLIFFTPTPDLIIFTPTPNK